jgi:DNA-directed RNA polymerase specialized sigma24 family protein
MFNDRGQSTRTGSPATRQQRLAILYAQNAIKIQRIVARHAGGYVEDACQVAWERLLSHEEATREAWRRCARRELSFDGPRGKDDTSHGVADTDDFEPVCTEPDPLTVAIERDEVRRRLGVLSERERQYLALQVLGLTYEEISLEVGATRRTVERQLLRAKRKLRPDDED